MAKGKKPAKKVAAKPVSKKPAPKGKSAKVARGAAAKTSSRRSRRFIEADIHLFSPLSEGERADALRTLIEDKRVANMAKVGRYRVIAVEPIVLKPPHERTGHRLARIAAFDYAADRAVDALVDLDDGIVAHLNISSAQPMLAREEEAAAVAIALADDRVKNELSLGDEPQVAMHYWSRRDTDLAYARRSAAVLFGQAGARPSFVAVIDLLDSQVTELVPAEQW